MGNKKGQYGITGELIGFTLVIAMFALVATFVFLSISNTTPDCIFSREVKTIDYDLIDDHKLTCSKIKYALDNWQPEYEKHCHILGCDLIEKKDGSGQLKLIKTKTIYGKQEHCNSTYSMDSTELYTKSDIYTYYITNCNGKED